MKPLAVFRHVAHEGPGKLGELLTERQIPWQLIAIDQGEVAPGSPAGFSGLVFMGGPMSVNDDLPWIVPSIELIRKAVASGIPVLGHCLGGQLMAKALGGAITRNPVKEIGWGRARTTAAPEAARWFGTTTEFPAFHWHGETFSIPDGAVRILETAHCANQAFTLNDRHLALQCHVEMTEAMIREWCEVGKQEIAASDSPAVQPVARILEQTPDNLPLMSATAETIYSRWLAGLNAT